MHADTLKFYKYTPVNKPAYQGKFCKVPFYAVQIDNDGDVQLCDCQLHMPYTIGNIFENSLQEIWLNHQAQAVRQAVADGNFTYCNWACPRLNQLPLTPATMPTVREFPRDIQFNLDLSCNLKCPSCRETVIIEKNSYKIQKQVELFKEITQWALNNPQHTVMISPVATGEVFASHSGLKFLESLVDYPHKNLRIKMMTNGTLIAKNKKIIDKIYHLIDYWSISIDAATPETYAKVRGGDWAALINGLDYIKTLDSPAPIICNFCVQEANWHEIVNFSKLMSTYKAKLSYQNLLDFGHWTIDWWHNNNVLDRTKEHYRTVLSSLQQVKNQYPYGVGFSSAIIQGLKKIGSEDPI